MKTALLIVILTSCITRADGQFTFGPVLGINFSGTTGGFSFTNYDHDYGWKAGGIMSIPIGKKYFLVPGLSFETKSYKYNFADAYPVNNVIIPSYYFEHLIFGYISVPVLIQRNFSSGFHVGAGVFMGYQVSQQRKETVEYAVEVNSLATDVTATTSDNHITADRFQMGTEAGIGVMKSGFDLSVTSQYHLTPLYNFTTDDPHKLHFFNIALSLTYHFRTER